MTGRFCSVHPAERLLALSGACPQCDFEAFREELVTEWRRRHPPVPAGPAGRCEEHGADRLMSNGMCPVCSPWAIAWDQGFFGDPDG